MQKEVLADVIQYIEENLKTNITGQELADYAGYSLYHFYRLFSSEMEISLAAYILNRRLKNALYEIAQGYKAIDVVLEYGFATYAGFYKAFVREYGCSLKKYISIYGVPIKKPQKKEILEMSVTKKQINELLAHWDINQNLPIYDVAYMDGRKISDTVWRIGDEYYLKKQADQKHILHHSIFANALHKEGLASPLIVRTKEGQEYVGETELFVLMKRVKGMPYELLDSFGDKAQDYASECGKAIARLHRALNTITDPINIKDTNLLQTVTEWALPNVRKQSEQWSLRLPEAFFDDLAETFGVLYQKLPYQTIHRDPNPSNILFEQELVAGFIDFELSERNIRLFDPCYCATGLLSIAKTNQQYETWLAIAANILRGYDEINPLSEEEKRSVYYVICSIQLICIAYFNQFDDPSFQQLAKVNRKMLQFIVSHQYELEHIFK